MTKNLTFTAVLESGDTALYQTHIEIPAKVAAKVTSPTNKRVVCTLNHDHTFQAGIMPLGQGRLMIMINAVMRKKMKLKVGDEIIVTLQKDESEYGLPLPVEFEELLKQDEVGNELFHKLTAGKQRTLLYIIGKPKSPDLRIRNGIVVLQHLKNHSGVINYKQLNIDMKNAI